MKFLPLLSFAQSLVAASENAIQVSKTPVNASAPIPEAFVSYSIEFAFFPDFAGECMPPNLGELCLNSLRKYLSAKRILKQSP